MNSKSIFNSKTQILVTGGAGFIGSHLVDELIKLNCRVIVYDNFSTGKKIFISSHLGNPNFKLIKADLNETKKLSQAMKGVDIVFHLAAHADVRSGFDNHFIDHEQNLEMTQNVLEAMFKQKVKKIAFASTSSVYGDAFIHPTPEDYILRPTSLYGASKAACEQYLHAYSAYYQIETWIFRFVSFVGERYTHGIIYDLLQKLAKNSHELELLSDGSPKKSSLYVKDGIRAIIKAINTTNNINKNKFNIFNLGHDKYLTVREIVELIIKTAAYSNVKQKWLGKKSNWQGDNEFVLLDTSKIKSLGWQTQVSLSEGIVKTVRYLQAHPELF